MENILAPPPLVAPTLAIPADGTTVVSPRSDARQLFRISRGRLASYEVDALLADVYLNPQSKHLDQTARSVLLDYFTRRREIVRQLAELYANTVTQELLHYEPSRLVNAGDPPRLSASRAVVSYTTCDKRCWALLDDLPAAKEIMEFKRYVQEDTAWSVMQWFVRAGMTSAAEASMSAARANILRSQ